MKTRSEYIELIRAHANEIRTEYGVTALRLFGSVARDQQTETSDVDICVVMPPRIFKVVGLGTFLEELLGCRVDIVREHGNMNSFLKSEIERDGIYVFN